MQAELPIWVGGGGEKVTLRIAAEHADGWNMPFVSPETWAHKSPGARRPLRGGRRDPAEVTRTVNLGLVRDEDDLRLAVRGHRRLRAPGRADRHRAEVVDTIGRLPGGGRRGRDPGRPLAVRHRPPRRAAASRPPRLPPGLTTPMEPPGDRGCGRGTCVRYWAGERPPDAVPRPRPVSPSTCWASGPGRSARRPSGASPSCPPWPPWCPTGSCPAAASSGSTGPGATALALGLVAAASAAGAWTVVVGVPDLGLVAAARPAWPSSGPCLVAPPPPEQWSTVVAALAESVERAGGAGRRPDAAGRPPPAAQPPPGRGGVLVQLPGRAAWPEAARPRPAGRPPGVAGGGGTDRADGAGRLRARRVVVEVEGRGRAARPRRRELWLPGADGRLIPPPAGPVAPARGGSPCPRGDGPEPCRAGWSPERAERGGERTLVARVPDWPVVAAGVAADEPVVVVHANRVVACLGRGPGRGRRRGPASARGPGPLCPRPTCVAADPARDARVFEPAGRRPRVRRPRVEVTPTRGRCAFATRGPSRYYGGDEALAARVAEVLADGAAPGRHRCTSAWPTGPSPPPARPAPRPGPGRRSAADGRQRRRSRSSPRAARPPSSPRGRWRWPPATSTPPRPRRSADVLGRLGLRTLGALADLPGRRRPGPLRPRGRAAAPPGRGLDPRPLAARRPAPELAVAAELDPPVERVDVLAFGPWPWPTSSTPAWRRDGLACLRVGIEVETEHGERRRRSWRHEGGLDRRRRWPSGSAGSSTGGSRARWSTGPPPGSPGCASTPRRSCRRAVASSGSGAGRPASTRGRPGPWPGWRACSAPRPSPCPRCSAGAAPASGWPWSRRRPSTSSARAAGAGRAADGPWPGRLPAPSPALVFPDPAPVELVGRPTAVPVGGRRAGRPSAPPPAPAAVGPVGGGAGPGRGRPTSGGGTRPGPAPGPGAGGARRRHRPPPRPRGRPLAPRGHLRLRWATPLRRGRAGHRPGGWSPAGAPSTPTTPRSTWSSFQNTTCAVDHGVADGGQRADQPADVEGRHPIVGVRREVVEQAPVPRVLGGVGEPALLGVDLASARQASGSKPRPHACEGRGCTSTTRRRPPSPSTADDATVVLLQCGARSASGLGAERDPGDGVDGDDDVGVEGGDHTVVGVGRRIRRSRA